MSDPYWKDKIHERFADNAAAHRLPKDIEATVIENINGQMEQIEIVREWEHHKSRINKPFKFIEHMSRFDELVRTKKVRFSYDPAPHQAVVTLRDDKSVAFREPYEGFPSDWMMAQIALALECATK